MSGLSDAELKKRLEDHNYQVSPITTTTRELLKKKLAQLDGECRKSYKGKKVGFKLKCYIYKIIFRYSYLIQY